MKGIKIMIIKNFETYNGSILQDRFAYSFFKDKVLRTGNIIAGISPAQVEADYMIDKEDLISKDYIYSEKMIHFLIEIPDVSLFAGVCFQRLYCNMIGNILARYVKSSVEIDGDDIFVIKEHNQGGVIQQKGKASVSIAKHCNDAVLIHIGINVKAGKRAPAFAFSTNLTDQESEAFMRECISAFYEMIHDVFIATTKILK